MTVYHEDRECGVCYHAYTRWERVPRLLHCGHFLCTLCLKQLCQAVSSLLVVRCPFCRWASFIGPNLSLQEGLWVHSKVWDQISEYEECEDEEEKEQKEKEEEEEQVKEPTQLTRQSTKSTKWLSLERYRLQLQVPPFLKRISCLFRLSHRTSKS